MLRVLNFSKVFSRFLYLLFSLAILVSLSYFFAYFLISYPLHGPDNRMNLDYIIWLDHYFPHIPLWWPAEGGGTSFVSGYPILYHLAIIVSHKIIPNLSLVAWMGIWNFLSIVLTGIGIYFLAWRIFKSQTLALIAGFFYHLSPLSYILVAKWGFLTTAFSFIFVAPSFLFFDIFCQQRKEKSRWALTSLFLTGVFLVITFLAHPITGIGLFIALGFWVIIESIFIYGFSKKLLIGLRKNIISLVILSSVFLGLVAFYFFPFYEFTNFSNRGIDAGILMESKNISPSDIWATLGFQKFGEFWDLAIAIPVWSLAILGIFLGFFFKRKGTAFTLLSFLMLGLMSQKSVHILVNKIWPLMGLFFNWRYFLGSAIVLVPIAGAFGIYCLARSILLPLEIIGKRLSKKKALLVKIPHSIALAGLMIVGSILIIYLTNFSNLADPEHQITNVFHYGVDFNGVNLSTLWNRPQSPDYDENFTTEANLWEQLKNFPPIELTDSSDCHNSEEAEGMANLYQANRQFIDQTRLYVLGYNGWNYCWPIKHQTSFFNLYTSQLYLNKPYISFFGDTTNNQNEIDYQSKVDNLCKWFGVDAIIDKLSGLDAPDRFQPPYWQREEKFGVYRSGTPVGLASLRFAPRVLLIGSQSKRAYEQFFRLAGLGGFYYQDGTLIEGKERIDDYSLEELERFNLIILSGYGYRNRNKAWQLLSNYVQQGGSVFIDSGWQFVAADWGITKLAYGKTFVTDYPDPSPVKKTTWGNIGTSWAGASLEFDDLDLSKFAPPTWEDKPWSMAVAERTDLAEGAKPILSRGDKVIIAQKDYGEGKIIWSGMNLIAHGYDKKNSEEILFINKLLTSLAKTNLTDLNQLWPQRTSPDQPIFTLNQETNQSTLLYFREAYHPFWQARLVQGGQEKKLEIYSAGPQLMAVILPPLSQNNQVLFRFSAPLRYYLYYLISLATFLFLITLNLDSIFWQGKWLKLVLDKIKIWPTKLTQRTKRLREDFYTKENEDY